MDNELDLLEKDVTALVMYDDKIDYELNYDGLSSYCFSSSEIRYFYLGMIPDLN